MGKGLAIIFFLIMIPFSVIQILIFVSKTKLDTIIKWVIAFCLITTIIIFGYANFIIIAWIPFIIMMIVSLLLNNYFSNIKKFPIYFLLIGWGVFLGGSGMLLLLNPYFEPMKVKRENLYGTYEIMLNKFDKKQASWQHKNYELEITKDSYLKLYKLKPSRYLIDSVTINIEESSVRANFSINSDSLTHHIIKNDPTLFRKSFKKFYLVFKSEKYDNMFFKKK